MEKRSYYIYKGYMRKYPWTYDEVLSEARGLIIKCYTEEEFNRFHGGTSEVWEKVEEQKW